MPATENHFHMSRQDRRRKTCRFRPRPNSKMVTWNLKYEMGIKNRQVQSFIRELLFTLQKKISEF
jgi:hypothetical protein